MHGPKVNYGNELTKRKRARKEKKKTLQQTVLLLLEHNFLRNENEIVVHEQRAKSKNESKSLRVQISSECIVEGSNIE